MPIPVKPGLVAERKRDRDPAPPRLRQWSPSSARPCTAIAASAASATCSWRRAAARLRFGRLSIFAAIASPSKTDSETSKSADDARRVPHEPPDIWGAADARLIRRAARARDDWRSGRRRSRSPRPRRCRARSRPRARRARVAHPPGPSSKAIFDSVSASSALPPSAVAPINPLQTGDPVLGSSR